MSLIQDLDKSSLCSLSRVHSQQFFIPKRIKKGEVTSGRLVRFDQFDATDYLASQDLMRLFGISRATFARYLSQHGLRPSKRVRRRTYFKKDDVERWWGKIAGKKKLYQQAVGRVARQQITCLPGSGKTHSLMALLLANRLLEEQGTRDAYAGSGAMLHMALHYVNSLLEDHDKGRRVLESVQQQLTDALSDIHTRTQVREGALDAVLQNPPFRENNLEDRDEGISGMGEATS